MAGANAPVADGSAVADLLAARHFGNEVRVAASAAQQEVFVTSMMSPAASLAYIQSVSWFFPEPPDLDAIYSALLNLIQRHEALRGHFSADGRQFIARERIAFELPVQRLQGTTAEERRARYEAFIREEMARPFDLTRGPLFRATAIDRGPDGWVVVFSAHLSVLDGWSVKTLMREFPVLYSELVAGRATTSLPGAPSFVDFLGFVSDRDRREGDTCLSYWRRQFSEGVPVLELPLDNPRPRMRTYTACRIDYRVDPAVHSGLRKAGARTGISEFLALLSAFSLYMGRLAGQRDFVIGVPAYGQIKCNRERVVGHDAHLLPLRVTIEEGDDFPAFARRFRDRFLEAYEHPWVTLPGLIRMLDIKVDASRVPLMPVVFGFDPGISTPFGFGDISVTHHFNQRASEIFEVQINAVVEKGALVLEWTFNADLFDEAAMHERLRQFETLMRSIAEAPGTPVLKLPVVPADQVQRMDSTLNSTSMPFERACCVDELVHRSVAATPDKVAVEFGESRLTYGELWDRSAKIAKALADAGAGPRSLVGVMLDRSADLIAVLLGVWRAGAAYVPLDPAYPPDRLDYMIEHSRMGLLLTERNIVNGDYGPGVRSLFASEILAGEAADFGPRPGRGSEDLAYVIYTSGSTGRPKGVQVPHRSLNNFLTSMRDRLPGFRPEDRLLAVTTLSFDIAELELWLPLVSGGSVVIADRGTAMDGAALMRVLEESRITVLQATPATWRLLIFSGWRGKQDLVALCGGEALQKDLADALLDKVRVLWNMYGPTETTVWSTIDRVDHGAITVGRPIGNTQTYVLDASNAWVPQGSVGELWIGGDGVTHGYLGRDDLTRERFLPNPFTGRGMMYRTGDLVRLRRDGRIEYIGRNDFQVKVRGYRIELGEVQHALARVRGIRQCVVVVKDRQPGDSHLVAYYTTNPGHTATAEELKEALRQTLPDYMVPGWYMELTQMPLTDNGKINVKALPDPFQAGTGPVTGTGSLEDLASLLVGEEIAKAAVMQVGSPAGDRPVAFVVPSGAHRPSEVSIRRQLCGKVAEDLIPGVVILVKELPRSGGRVDHARLLRHLPAKPESLGPDEALVIDAWSRVLGLRDVRLDDGFRDLGGDSLAAMQVIGLIERRTGTRLEPADVLTGTPAQLARMLQGGTPA